MAMAGAAAVEVVHSASSAAVTVVDMVAVATVAAVMPAVEAVTVVAADTAVVEAALVPKFHCLLLASSSLRVLVPWR